MTHTMFDDPDDEDLRAIAPPLDQRPFPAARRADVKTMLMDEVRASRRHRWRTPLLAGVATALVGTTIAAGSYIAFREPTERHFAFCYSAATADPAYRTELGVAAPQRADSTPPGPVEIQNAVDSCANVWRLGVIHAGEPGAPGPQPGDDPAPVPDLAACTLPDGSVAVYPGDATTCRTLNLPSATKP